MSPFTPEAGIEKERAERDRRDAVLYRRPDVPSANQGESEKGNYVANEEVNVVRRYLHGCPDLPPDFRTVE